MTKIASFELYQFQIDLTVPLPVAKQRIDHRIGIIVNVTLDDNQQYFAEISPLAGIDIEGLPLTGFSHETLAQVSAELIQLQSQLIGQEITELAQAAERSLLPSVQFGLSVLAAKCLQQFPVRVITQANIPLLYHGLSTTVIDQKLADLSHIHSVKIKVAQTDMDSEIAFVHQVLARKPSLTLRLDANRGFTLNQAVDFLACLPKKQIEYVEEPCQQPSDNLKMYQQLGIKYALDEFLLTADLDFDKLLQQQPGIGAFILKPMLLGSLSKMQEIVSLAEHQGVRCIVSSSLESDVGIADLALISQALTPDNPPGLDTLSAFSQRLLDENGQLKLNKLKLIKG
ncbi:o-succinylbenzoate synthase [Shewanella glacialimarina]|jgi:O-succinylbenzoate synthase|uniref:o-succinylbenzoate synthase n=1 Tax=Shewanella glacialimarina TaxID=2590884 RepID=UPI001CF8240D|nr:o-succinylbenzoate synthase [Shewanella glacialimarina]UCX03240.1 o-succinylbenzoate synthase [Shewanella glacialimarina]